MRQSANKKVSICYSVSRDQQPVTVALATEPKPLEPPPPETTVGYNAGYIPDEFDERDKPYSFKGKADQKIFLKDWNLLEDMPVGSNAAYPEWLNPIYNQSAQSSCVANATAAMIRFLAFMIGDTVSPAANPSRQFIYFNAWCLKTIERGIKGARK